MLFRSGAQILAALANKEKRWKEFIEERLSKETKAFDATLSKQNAPFLTRKEQTVSRKRSM